jgi:hypothetical protein
MQLTVIENNILTVTAYQSSELSKAVLHKLNQSFSAGVPREISIEKKHRFLNLLAKINRSTEKYHSLLKRALTIIIGLLYLQVTDHANVQ